MTASKPVSTPPLALNCTSLYWDKEMSGPMWHFESICLTNGKGLKKGFFSLSGLSNELRMIYWWRSIIFHISWVHQQRWLCHITPKKIKLKLIFLLEGLSNRLQKNSDYFGTKDWPLVFCPSKQYHKTYDTSGELCRDSLEFYTDLGKLNCFNWITISDRTFLIPTLSTVDHLQHVQKLVKTKITEKDSTTITVNMPGHIFPYSVGPQPSQGLP